MKKRILAMVSAVMMASAVGLSVVKENLVTRTYAEEANDYGTLKGDVNNDGVFSVADAILLQKWLLTVPDTHLANWKAADFYEDDQLDVFDLCLMKRALIQKSQDKQITYSVTEKKLLRENMSQHEETEVQIAFSLDELRYIVETAENVEYETSAPDGIDDSFFNDKALLVVYTGATASNTYTIIDNIERKQDNLTISTITRTPTVAFPDMAYRRFILAVNKADVQGITSVDTIDTATPFDIDERESVYQWYVEWIGS